MLSFPSTHNKTPYFRGQTTVFRPNVAHPYTPERIALLEQAMSNIIFFAENFFTITTLDKGKQKIELYQKQKEILQEMVKNRFVAITASRQSGKTTMLTIFALWLVCFTNDYHIAIIANKEATALQIFRRIRLAYEQLPEWLKPGVKEYGKRGFVLENDSTIQVATTTASTVRGSTLNCICLDEAAHIEPHLLEDFWASVIPTISSGKSSKIVMVSTQNRAEGKFYEIYTQARQNRLPEWKAFEIHWTDIPNRDEKWKQTMIAALGSLERFENEFDNLPLTDSQTAVETRLINEFKRIAQKQQPIWKSENENYIAWHYPQKNHLYVIGVDVGEGVQRNYSVAQVLDITNLQTIEQVARFSTNIDEPYAFANKLYQLALQWGMPPLLIERNNCGGQVIDALYHHLFYEKLVHYEYTGCVSSEASMISHRSFAQRKTSLSSPPRARQFGIFSHTNIRFEAVQNFRYWVNRLRSVCLYDEVTISELETFVKHPNGIFRRKNLASHDDHVMALIWALFVLHPSICSSYFDVIEVDACFKPQKIASLETTIIKEEKAFTLFPLDGKVNSYFQETMPLFANNMWEDNFNFNNIQQTTSSIEKENFKSSFLF